MKIIFYQVPSLLKYNPEISRLKGVGGLESCVIELAKEFSKRGHDVTCYNTHNTKEIFDNTKYLNSSFYGSEDVDLFVGCSSFPEKVNAKKKINWIHRFADISILRYPNVDYTVFVSEWHKEYLVNKYNLKHLLSKIKVISNGISEYFLQEDNIKKENKLFYANHPRKGLEYINEIFPVIKKAKLDVSCEIFSSAGLWGEDESKYTEIYEKLISNNINVVGRLGQEELAKRIASCKIHLYPSIFIETFGLSILESMSKKCVTISSYIGNIPSLITNNQNGFLVKGKPHEKKYQDRVVDIVLDLLNNNDRFEEISNNAHLFAKEFTWSKAADEFEKLL